MKVTIGEALARRRLKQSKMPGSGDPIYNPGQYHCAKLSDEDCTVSWVGADGTVNIMPCELVNDDWVKKGVMITATAKGYAAARMIPRNSTLSGSQIDVIRAKYNPVDDEEDETPPPSGPDGEGDSQGAGEQ